MHIISDTNQRVALQVETCFREQVPCLPQWNNDTSSALSFASTPEHVTLLRSLMD